MRFKFHSRREGRKCLSHRYKIRKKRAVRFAKKLAPEWLELNKILGKYGMTTVELCA